eukprot:GHVR01134659.1.p1 GENE.GHVR01134659.1~~GHVR01134659.1.p1  ORF type:complete len:319 (+),score=55.00 GHVR01134659.1:605-1561(+)
MSKAVSPPRNVESDSRKLVKMPNWMTLVISGAAGCGSWMFVHPVDSLKTRMQLANEGGKKGYNSLPHALKTIFKTEGPFALYGGLSAGLTRQATYTALRAGLYQIFRDKGSEALSIKDGPSATALRAGCGLMSGAISATICCPVEVALVRMQADGRNPVAERRGYTNVFNAISRIVKEEGLATCWRGSNPTVVRAMVVNMVQLATYDEAKDWYKRYLSGFPLHVAASVTSGFFFSASSLPFDVVKVRMQNQKLLEDGSKLYSGVFQTFKYIKTTEGIGALWRGFVPYFGRSGLNSIGFFVLLEQLKMFLNTMGYATPS